MHSPREGSACEGGDDGAFMHHAATCNTLTELPDLARPESLGKKTTESYSSQMSLDTLATYDSDPEFPDSDWQRSKASEAATCDTLSDVMPRNTSQEFAFDFEVVEEGSHEDDNSPRYKRYSSEKTDAGSGLRAATVDGASWGRSAALDFGFEVDKVLKLGQFGGVRLMRSLRNRSVAVAKCKVNTGVSDHKPVGRREYELLQSLRHDNIISPSFFLETKYETYMFLEWCTNGSLWMYVTSRREGLQLREVRSLGLQLIDAIDHVHSACILHCSVQPANILITHGGLLRLSGFGSSRRRGHNASILCPELSPEELARAAMHDVLLAPELSGFFLATPKTDVWGFALCSVFMFSGKTTPDGLQGGPPPTCSLECHRWDTASAWYFWETCLAAKQAEARPLYSMVAKSLDQNPTRRPSIPELEF